MISGVLCIATVVYLESRGQPLWGQWLVAQTVLERVEDPRFPDTPCDVVQQRRAFSYRRLGSPSETEAWSLAQLLASLAVTLEPVAAEVRPLYFNRGTACQNGANKLTTIGGHTFCR